MPNLQYKKLMHSSSLLAVSRMGKWGAALFSFERLAAFCNPFSQKIYVFSPIKWKTMYRHIASWREAVIAAQSIQGFEGFETVNASEDDLHRLFNEFLRMPD